MKLRFNSTSCFIKRMETWRNSDGGKFTGFSDTPHELKATVYSKEGQLQIGSSGYVQQYQRKLLYEAPYSVSNENGVETYVFEDFSMAAGDGICLYADKAQEPDYRIVAIHPYTGHVKIYLERI